MSDMSDTGWMWKEFAVETEEHFEILERLLVGAESEQATAADIGQLFRSFHSVKGLARAMDVLGMERLAHRAENLLGLVRDGQTPLDPPLIQLLLEGLDVLKSQGEIAVAEHRDSPAPDALVERLEAAQLERTRAASTAAASASPPAPASGSVPAPAAPTPASPPVIAPPTTVLPAPTMAESPTVASTDSAAAALDVDPEMLQYFIEMLEADLPTLHRLATPEIEDATLRAEALDKLETLEHAAGVMGFEHLGTTFGDLLALLRSEDPTASERRREAVTLLGDLRAAIYAIGQMSGRPEPLVPLAATSALSAVGQRLEAGLHEEFIAQVNELAGVLTRFETTGDSGPLESDQTLADEIASLARSLYKFLLFMDLRQAGQLMLMVEDVFSRVADREMFLYPELLHVTRDVADALRSGRLMAGEVADLDTITVDKLLSRFRKSLLTGAEGTSSNDPMATARRLLTSYDIKPELVDILSHENIRDLMAVTQVGTTFFYEIQADLESSEAFSRHFVTWLQQDTRPITNRTLFTGGTSWFEFLVVSALPIEALSRNLAAIDPGTTHTRLRLCAQRETAPPPAAASPPGSAPSVAPARGPRGEAGPRRSGTAAGGAAGGGSGRGGNVLRVPGEVVDRFIAQIGEMVTVGNMLDLTIKDSELGAALQILRRAVQGSSGNGAGGGEGADVAASLDKVEKAFQRLALADQQLHSVLGRLQENAMELRVVPIDTVFSRFPRVVRDLAQAHNKQIRLDMDGGEVRIDKGMVEVLVEPLMHMVRNSVDHAIESPEERAIAGKPPVARIGLRAVQQGNRVVVEIQDDGRGLNVQKIRTKAVERGIVSEAESRAMTDDQICHFIFAPGFSTADKVTETSGRGVGMDVVLTNMTRLGGNIDIRTRLGEGTTFSLQLPLSAAIQTALMVEAGGQLLAIPERHLAEIHDTTDSTYQTVRGQRAILLRNSFLPLFRLQDLLGHRSASERAGAQANDNTNATVRRPVVVLANGRKHIGIEVDRLLRRQDLFVKEIHPKLAAIPGVGGASILGDGRVVLILDGEDLFRLAERSGPAVPLHV